ncbi:unnamed protein product [Cylicostephanus goldi]|uniref:BPTI/Kunitz inhibitor domain-containing protein n=1 Tax=Cylicostephanus goldi TaxID=71465 RepID=A0A3P6QST9_CYLGO|nr:unnamed protein product [Cylicostephanus goldi]
MATELMMRNLENPQAFEFFEAHPLFVWTHLAIVTNEGSSVIPHLDHIRYAYDYEIEDCRPFLYGGCLANENNFLTDAECQSICFKQNKSTTTMTPGKQDEVTPHLTTITIITTEEAPTTTVEISPTTTISGGMYEDKNQIIGMELAVKDSNIRKF